MNGDKVSGDQVSGGKLSLDAMSLENRRAALKAAAKDPGADVQAFHAVLGDVNEEDRKTLAKTLPASKLFRTEGPTARAAYVFTALGRPMAVVESVFPLGETESVKMRPHHGEIVPAVKLAASTRENKWAIEFIEMLSEYSYWGGDWAWDIAHQLVRERGPELETLAYLEHFVRMPLRNVSGQSPDERVHILQSYLESQPGVIDHELMALFRTEGMGSSYYLSDPDDDVWQRALGELARTNSELRARLLRESLNGLLRDFSLRNVKWYIDVHRQLDASMQEILDNQNRYISILSATPSTAVGLALEHLSKVAEGLEGPLALIDASRSVLQRSEKKLVKAQLGILRALAKDHPDEVSAVVIQALPDLPPDLAEVATKLVVFNESASAHAQPSPGSSVLVPGPRRNALADTVDAAPEIASVQELVDLLAVHFEGLGNGADIPRILNALWRFRMPEQDYPALAARAKVVFEEVWDGRGTSSRRHLASVTSIWLGEPVPTGRSVTKAGTTWTRVDASGDQKVLAATASKWSTLRYRTDGIDALLCKLIREVGFALLLPKEKPHTLKRLEPHHFAPRGRDSKVKPWSRAKAPSGARLSRVIWVLTDGDPSPDAFIKDSIDTAWIESRFRHLAETARDQDGYDQTLQWASWFFGDNLDALAAHFHPMLWMATQVVNVRGLSALMEAIASARAPLEEPSYSALALAMSAKMADHRAAAAEAFAALSNSGFLDPQALAGQLFELIEDQHVMAGRVAESLSDAASINAIAGYRVLQTLALLLPKLDGVTGAAKLVELCFTLAQDYGTAVAIPDELAGKAKGSSALAVALRALAGVVPHETELACQAAAQATDAMKGGNRE